MARKKTEPQGRYRRKQLKPKTDNQAEYINSMTESSVTLCSGPAGSGKTSVAVGLACEYLLADKVKKIVITRPVVESGRGLGHLPGTMLEKINPYLIPILEEMGMYLTKKEIREYMDDEIIELCPLEYMRGRNFHNSFVILDEAQNATFEQLKMFVTRIGRGSKAVINGDLKQSDLGKAKGGLSTCMERLDGIEDVSICHLDYCDIVRSDVVARILKSLNNIPEE
tara:strand:- start:33895 stop:34569 length:675 start_codon:yes stop_codon:yes gene_type:complete